MKKKISCVVRSIGSEPGEPDAADVAAWISGHRGEEADLISYALDRTLAAQDEVENRCAGGLFYGERILESLVGVKDGMLRGEPSVDLRAIRQDAERIRRAGKWNWCALPSLTSLDLEDEYFNDREEFVAALSELYRKIMREMRDAGVQGHVILGDRFSELEREELASRKVIFASPTWDSAANRGILSVQHTLVLPATHLGRLELLLENYEVRSVCLLDGEPKEFTAACAWFDPQEIVAGGYAPTADPDYWKNIISKAYLLQ